MQTLEYTYGRRKMEVEVVYSNRSTLGLKVFPMGNVLATAPIGTSLETIISKIKPKSKWILEQQKSFELLKPFTPERKYIPGETHRYLGRQYKLRISTTREQEQITLKRGELLIGAQVKDIEKALKKWYKVKADELFIKTLNTVLEENPIFKSFEISLRHKYLSKRWGSCSTTGNILLNTELIKASKACIEYVIMHELCHLIEPNHSKRFYSLLNDLLPHWKKLKEKLEKDLI